MAPKNEEWKRDPIIEAALKRQKNYSGLSFAGDISYAASILVFGGYISSLAFEVSSNILHPNFPSEVPGANLLDYSQLLLSMLMASVGGHLKRRAKVEDDRNMMKVIYEMNINNDIKK